MANAIADISSNQDVYSLAYTYSINSYTLLVVMGSLQDVSTHSILKGRHSKFSNRKNIGQYIKPTKICKSLILRKFVGIYGTDKQKVLETFSASMCTNI